MIATAKYSTKFGGHEHHLACLNLTHTDPKAILFAESQGMKIPPARTRENILEEMAKADIVQLNWWQHPEWDEFLRSELPPCRILGWFHVAGDYPPQLVTRQLVDFVDLAVGGSSYTFECPAFAALSEQERAKKLNYVVGGADFSRLATVTPKPHRGFNVGYIGTVNPVKIYKRFVPLHQGLDIEEAKVIVCGGDKQAQYSEEAKTHGLEQLFDFRGYVEDITSVLEILDVYGYPLCHDTYAASELNLQEAMFAGIPPVVFPHGGLKTLVVNEYTGLVVRTEHEYRQALKQLATDRQLRETLGKNAKRFAQEMFGAENNAPKINLLYEQLVKTPKQNHSYETTKYSQDDRSVGTDRFLESLGSMYPEYLTSFRSTDLTEQLEAENQIMRATPLMTLAGLMPYQGHYKGEPFLKLWAGLAQLGNGDYLEAGNLLLSAHQKGLPYNAWRVFWYLALCGLAFKDRELAYMAIDRIRADAPDFKLADQLYSALEQRRDHLVKLDLLAPEFA